MSALTSRDDSPNDKECKDGHDDCCDPGDYIVRSPIDVTAHEAAIITKQYHQYKDQRQEHAAYHVGQVEHKDQAILWYEQGNARAYRNDKGIERQELRCFFEISSDAALPAEGFRNRVRGGERQDAGGHQRGIE